MCPSCRHAFSLPQARVLTIGRNVVRVLPIGTLYAFYRLMTFVVDVVVCFILYQNVACPSYRHAFSLPQARVLTIGRNVVRVLPKV
jgi:hypothetical protein